MKAKAPADDVEAAAESVIAAGARSGGRLDFGNVDGENFVLTAGGRLALVDRDEAVGAFRVGDYAGLTYWYSYTLEDGAPPGGAGPCEARDIKRRGTGC